MSAAAHAFFIVSSGRSGTAMLQKALAAAPGVEIQHEYMVHIVQPLAVKRYHGLIDADGARAVLAATHGAAVRYCEAAQWGDSSNKLAWLIPDLLALLPQARFVHLVRDGRKVAGSYLRKLGAECYDGRSTALMAAYLADPARNSPPPPEKKYWWPQALGNDPWAQEFARFSQFERIAWHWAAINEAIFEGLKAVPPAQQHFVRLETLRESPAAAGALFEFLSLPCATAIAESFARPHNVNRPEDRLLDAGQAAAFARIAEPMMVRLGYAGRPEYVVKY